MAAVLRQCGSVYNSKKETSRSHLEFPFKNHKWIEIMNFVFVM